MDSRKQKDELLMNLFWALLGFLPLPGSAAHIEPRLGAGWESELSWELPPFNLQLNRLDVFIGQRVTAPPSRLQWGSALSASASAADISSIQSPSPTIHNATEASQQTKGHRERSTK